MEQLYFILFDKDDNMILEHFDVFSGSPEKLYKIPSAPLDLLDRPNKRIQLLHRFDSFKGNDHLSHWKMPITSVRLNDEQVSELLRTRGGGRLERFSLTEVMQMAVDCKIVGTESPFVLLRFFCWSRLRELSNEKEER